MKEGVQKTPSFTSGAKTYAPGLVFAAGDEVGFAGAGFLAAGFGAAGLDVDVAAGFVTGLADVSAGFVSCFAAWDLARLDLSAESFFPWASFACASFA